MSHNEARDQRRGGRGTLEARRQRQMQPTVLALEPRTLLSNMYFHPPKFVPPAGSTINISGTTAGTIVVKQGNGNNDRVTIYSNAPNIEVDIGNGSGDSVTIVDPNGNVTVNVGDGNKDSVTIESNGTVTVTVGSVTTNGFVSGTNDVVSITGNGNKTVTTGTDASGTSTVSITGGGAQNLLGLGSGWNKV